MVLLMSSSNQEILIVVLMAQFVVGAIQLVLALIQTIVRLNKQKPLGNLKTYWTLVGGYFLGGGIIWIIVSQIHDLKMLGWTWFFSAWAIAVYYIVKGWR
jgi:apolipoprotein N-acyltransferase